MKCHCADCPVVLNPNVKLAYAEETWDAEQLRVAVSCLETVVRIFLIPMFLLLFLSESQFDSYYKPHIVLALDSDPPLAASSSESVKYGNSWMWKTLQTRQAHDCSTGNPHEELHLQYIWMAHWKQSRMSWCGEEYVVLYCLVV